MPYLTLLGLVMALTGLGGLAWCIVQGLRIRRAGLPAAEIHARLHQLLAINLGSVGLGALGLAFLVAGFLL